MSRILLRTLAQVVVNENKSLWYEAFRENSGEKGVDLSIDRRVSLVLPTATGFRILGMN